MSQPDFDERIERVLGAPGFARASSRARVIREDATALRSLLVSVERARVGHTGQPVGVDLDIACAVLDAQVETLETGAAGDPSDRLESVAAALEYLADGGRFDADGLALLHWSVGIGLPDTL